MIGHFFCSLVITGIGRHWYQLCNISHAKWWAQRFYRNCTLSCCIVLHKRNILGMRLFVQLLININIIKLFSLYELGFYSKIPRDMPIHVNIVSLSVCLCVSLCLSVSRSILKILSLSLECIEKKSQYLWNITQIIFWKSQIALNIRLSYSSANCNMYGGNSDQMKN